MEHTKGKWKVSTVTRKSIWIGADIHIATCHGLREQAQANARLIATAPVMDMLLSLLASGEARIEHSKTTDLVEFCWRGIRYPCSDCDWAELVNTIGYEKIKAAIAAVKED